MLSQQTFIKILNIINIIRNLIYYDESKKVQQHETKNWKKILTENFLLQYNQYLL